MLCMAPTTLYCQPHNRIHTHTSGFVYIHIRHGLFTYTYVTVCLHTHTSRFVYIHIWHGLFTYTYVTVCLHTHTSRFVYTHIRHGLFTYTYVTVCLHTHTSRFVYIHIRQVCLHTHTSRFVYNIIIYWYKMIRPAGIVSLHKPYWSADPAASCRCNATDAGAVYATSKHVSLCYALSEILTANQTR